MNKIKKELRRAFTIVELVVVIAVIAALAAILIPTFVNVVNSANEASDVSMLYNINLALATESDIETPEQALDIAAEQGYNIDKLTPSSEGYIVYDERTTSFALISTDNEVVYPTSNSSLDINAPTTWHFVSTNDLDSSNTITASYSVIITDAAASTSSADNAKTSVKSVKTATASGTTVSSGITLYYIGMGSLDTSRSSNVKEINYTYQKTDSFKTVEITLNANASSITVTTSVNITINSYNTENTLTEIKANEGVTEIIINDNTGSAYKGDDSIVKINGDEATFVGSSVTVSTIDGVLQMGTEKYPYLVEDNLQTTIETYATDEGKTYYFMLTEDVVATATSRGRRYTTIKSNIIVNGNSKTISANAEADTPTCVYLTSDGTYQFTLYNANILGYIEQDKAVLDLKDFNVTIEDCTMTETGTSCSDSCAITITGAKDINITNCTFTNSRLNIEWGNSDTENVAELSCTIEGTVFSYYISNYETSSDTAMGLINFGISTAYSGQYSVSVKIFDVTVQGRMQNVFVDENTVSNGSKATKLSYEVDTLNVTVSSYNGSDSTAFDVTLKSILGISDSDGVSVTETNCTYQVDGTKYSSYKDYTISE